ncbi:conserved hypothetical protein [Moraxellaceae bacterium 17A]|nr:conserved hypothetical protein [Moraxellaceae bacterium 17A]
MATQQQRITELAQAIAQDIKELKSTQGLLDSLPTTSKTSLVDAINELYLAISNSTGVDDSAENAISTWSSSKIRESINTAISELVNGSGSTLDTLKELADALDNDANFAATLAEQMGKRVRVDAAQTFTVAEQAQGCANLGIGNPDTDLLAVYTTAKA